MVIFAGMATAQIARFRFTPMTKPTSALDLPAAWK
jgi:hypothetical protein